MSILALCICLEVWRYVVLPKLTQMPSHPVVMPSVFVQLTGSSRHLFYCWTCFFWQDYLWPTPSGERIRLMASHYGPYVPSRHIVELLCIYLMFFPSLVQ